jgi:hypothetical protein
MPRKKSPVTRPGIDPETFRLVARRLNHYATPGPCSFIVFHNLNEEVLHRDKEERNIQRGAYSSKKEGYQDCHPLCKNRLPKHITEETYQRQEDRKTRKKT